MSKGKKLSPKAIVISVVAVLLVAAAVLIAVLVTKSADENKEKPETTTTTSASQEQNIELDMELVEYNGTQMPKTFADILAENESKRDAKCKEFGTVTTIGETKISLPEFAMYYYTKFVNKYSEARNSIATRGTNITGYDIEKMPDEQKYTTGEGTWANYFAYGAIQNIQETYANFQRACEVGTQLTSEDIDFIVYNYNSIKNNASRDKVSVDEHLAESYVEGVDLSMFMTRVIMTMYAKRYAEDEKIRLNEACTEAELQAKYDETPMLYQVAKVRVHMMASEFTQEEIDAIRNVEDFNEFAKNNHPRDDYDVEGITNLGYMTYAELEAFHGETVANWAFDKNREVGELGTVKDYLGSYVILVEKPAFTPCSHQILVYKNGRNGAQEKAAKFYEEWQAGEKTEASFRKLMEGSDYCEEIAATITDYDKEMEIWLADPARKRGDTAKFELSDAVYVVYYLEPNAEDFDWKKDVATDLASEKYDAEFKKLVEEKYVENVDDKVLQRCFKKVNVRIDKFNKKMAEK